MDSDSKTKKPSLQEALDRVRAVVRAVASGDLSHEAELGFPEDHPIGALSLGVNSMIEALREARAASTAHLEQLEQQIATIEAQRRAIRELSTPIIEVWNSVLCLPIVGVLDSARAADITRELLQAVVDRTASYVIIDVTGIQVMDTTTTDNFMRLAKAVTLLGAECVLSGVNPNVAHTMVQMGVELANVKCYRNLRDALRAHVRPVAVPMAAQPAPAAVAGGREE